MPAGERPAGGWPGVVLLHGSGGLFYDGEEGGCSEELQGQFASWAQTLNQRGYAVVMPASFYSRGFCEWHDDGVPDDYDKHERLVSRVFDAAAAGEWLCAHPDVDCSRLAVMGFSNGGSTTLMLLHEELAAADDPRLARLRRSPAFVGGVAYYPGCGLHGMLASDLDEEDRHRYYYPSAPVWVAHAEHDGLLDTCEEVRDPQVEAIAEQRGVSEDMFELEIYPGADHGFDDSDEDEDEADLAASLDARARTLAKLDEWTL